MAKLKAAQPARRKTAKKQQVGGRKPKALSKRDMEIAGYLQGKSTERPAPLKGKSKSQLKRIKAQMQVDCSKLLEFKPGIPADVDVVVKRHRATERRAALVAEGIIPPSKKAKKVAIRLTKKKHPNRGKKKLVRPKLIHNHRILIEGREMDAELAAHQEAAWKRMFTYGAPNLTARRPQEVVVI